jgi:hypothetical protein
MRPLQWLLNTDSAGRTDSRQFGFLLGLMFAWLLLLASGEFFQVHARFLSAAFAVISVQALLITARSSRERVIFVACAIYLFLEPLFVFPGPIEALSAGLIILFLLFIPLRLSVYVLDQKAVDANTVFGALCAYLFLGLSWAVIYEILIHISPDAIYTPTDREPDFITWVYFSFTTLSTLGYGDIVPREYLARMLAILEALVGQIYLVVIVARLVGTALTRHDKKD